MKNCIIPGTNSNQQRYDEAKRKGSDADQQPTTNDLLLAEPSR